MPNEMIEKLNSVVKLITDAANTGALTRGELLESSNKVVAAILMASLLCQQRLGRALMTTDAKEKRNILTSLQQGEVENLARVLDLCAPVAKSANELNHALSTKWVNVNIGAHELAREALRDLENYEAGLQNAFSKTLIVPAADNEIDAWIREISEELNKITVSSTNSLRKLTEEI